MKKYFLFALVLALAIMFWGCSGEPEDSENTENELVPEDFAFSVTWNTYGISSYDSASGKLVKTSDATNPEDYVTELILSEEQLTEIWEIISSMDLESYPEEYDPFSNLKSEPSQTIILSTMINGAQKEVRCENIAFGSEGTTKKGKAFLTAISDIVSIIESTSEWRALPNYEFFYD